MKRRPERPRRAGSCDQRKESRRESRHSSARRTSAVREGAGPERTAIGTIVAFAVAREGDTMLQLACDIVERMGRAPATSKDECYR